MSTRQDIKKQWKPTHFTRFFMSNSTQFYIAFANIEGKKSKTHPSTVGEEGGWFRGSTKLVISLKKLQFPWKTKQVGLIAFLFPVIEKCQIVGGGKMPKHTRTNSFELVELKWEFHLYAKLSASPNKKQKNPRNFMWIGWSFFVLFQFKAACSL